MFYNICVTLGMSPLHTLCLSLLHTLVAPETPMSSGAGLIQIRAGDNDTRRPHTGYICMINGGPISWKSRRQANVS